MHVVLITGKGGVGKTTVAAATAVHAAAQGLQTLVLSTDAAHSLSDVLGAPLGHEPIELGPRLRAQQLDGRRRFEESWSEIRSYLVDLLGWAGADAIDAAELSSLPGLDEILALENLREHAQRGDVDLIVVDCAPTAETLRLLALPDVLGWYLDRVFPTHRRMAKLTRPLLRRTTSIPLADDDLFESFNRFTERLDAVRSLLRDVDTTRIRLVTTPEEVVVAETRRTYAYLALYGYSLDAVVVNRVLGDAHQGPFFEEWRVRQARGLASIDATFGSVTQLESALEPFDLDRPRSPGDPRQGALRRRRPCRPPQPGGPRPALRSGRGSGHPPRAAAGRGRLDGARGAHGARRAPDRRHLPAGWCPSPMRCGTGGARPPGWRETSCMWPSWRRDACSAGDGEPDVWGALYDRFNPDLERRTTRRPPSASPLSPTTRGPGCLDAALGHRRVPCAMFVEVAEDVLLEQRERLRAPSVTHARHTSTRHLRRRTSIERSRPWSRTYPWSPT